MRRMTAAERQVVTWLEIVGHSPQDAVVQSLYVKDRRAGARTVDPDDVERWACAAIDLHDAERARP